jgi:TatA/E family protein of Tat protein translocase
MVLVYPRGLPANESRLGPTLGNVFQIGPLELLVVAIIALLVIGPAKLPDAARAMGRGMREFRSALNMDGDAADDQERLREP